MRAILAGKMRSLNIWLKRKRHHGRELGDETWDVISNNEKG